MGLNFSELSLCFLRACPLQPKHPCHKLCWNNARALAPPSKAIFSLYIQQAFVGTEHEILPENGRASDLFTQQVRGSSYYVLGPGGRAWDKQTKLAANILEHNGAHILVGGAQDKENNRKFYSI